MTKTLHAVGRVGQAVTLGNFSQFGAAPSSSVFTAESMVARAWRAAGTFSDFAASVDANGTSRAIALRKNSADGLVVSPTNSTAGIFTAAGTLAVAATDTINLRFTGTAPAFQLYWAKAAFEAEPPFHISYVQCSPSALGDGSFAAFVSASTHPTEANVQTRMRGGGTVANACVLLTATVPATTTVRLRKNGADGNSAVTLPSGVTGVFEDTTNTDTFADGDLLAWRATGQGAATPTMAIGAKVIWSTAQNDIGVFPFTVNANAADQFCAVVGAHAFSTSETPYLLSHGFAVNVRRFRANIYGNTFNATQTFRIRKNGADGNGVFTVPAGATGHFEDAVNSDQFSATDTISIKMSGATSGVGNLQLTLSEAPSVTQTVSPALFVDPDTINAPTVDQTGMIQVVDMVSGSTTTAGAFVIPFNITLQPDDVVYVFGGGFSAVALTIGPTTSGYTLLASKLIVGGWLCAFGCWRKRMGGTPDTGVTVNGSGASGQGVAYAAYVVRGVHANNEDAAATLDFATNAAPDTPAITTMSNGAMVLSLTGGGIDDASVTPPSGYGDLINRRVSGSTAFTVSGAQRTVPAAGVENPGAWGNYSGSHPWVGITVAVRPAVSLAQTVSPSHLDDSADTFPSPTVTRGSVTLSPTTFVDGDTINAPTVTRGARTLTPSTLVDPDTIPGPSVARGSVMLAAIPYTDPDSIPTPTVTRGAITLAPSTVLDPDSIDPPTVANTTALLPATFVDPDTIEAPAVTVGAVTLAPSLVVDPDNFGSPSILTGGALYPDELVDPDSFPSPTVTVGAVSIAPALFVDLDDIPGPTVSSGAFLVAPDHFVDLDSIPTPSIATGGALLPSTYVDPDVIEAPAVFVGSRMLAAPYLDDADTFPPASVTIGALVLSPDLFEDADDIPSPLVELATLSQVSPFINDQEFPGATITVSAITLSVGAFVDADTFYTHSIGAPRRRPAPRGDMFAEVDRARDNTAHNIARNNAARGGRNNLGRY